MIPGDVAYDNFELIEKFEPGTELWFGVTLKTPREMGWFLLVRELNSRTGEDRGT